MSKRIKLFAATLVMILSIIPVRAKDKLITIEDLPGKAVTFIYTHYSGTKVEKVEKENRGNAKYDVIFVNGHEVEFNKEGDWCKVDAPDNNTIPSKIIPSKIQGYINSKYSGWGVNEIEKTGKGYNVELVNGVKLIFNKSMEFVKKKK